MPSLREVVFALYGAWRLLLFDSSGMTWFELSIRGFWRSFFAAVLVAPFYAVWTIGELERASEPFDPGWVAVAEIVIYALDWAAFPVVAIFLTKALRLTGGYVPLIVASNWANVPQVLLYMVVLAITGFIPFLAPAAEIMVFVVTLYVLAYQWFIARTALQTTGLVAAAVVVVQLVLGIAVQLIGESLA